MTAFSGLIRKLFGDNKTAELAIDQAWQELVGHSPILYGVPKDTLAEMAGRLTTVPAAAGQVIVRQGDPGDAFYLIVRGSVTVTRQERPDAEFVPLATLNKGFWFGEEALLSQQPRNATVTMAEDGLLLHLASRDFNELLEKPRLHWYSAVQAYMETKAGRAVLLDVRPADEQAQGTLPNAVAAPLTVLRDIAATFNRKKMYVCFCETSRLSTNAAFVLDQLGYQAVVMRDGLAGLREMQQRGLLSTSFSLTAPPSAAPGVPAGSGAAAQHQGAEKLPENAPGRQGRHPDVDRVWDKLASHSPALLRLPDEVLEKIANRATPETVKRGQAILCQGDPPTAYYLLVKGSAKVTRQDESQGSAKVLAELSAGTGLGDDALLLGEAQHATVTMTAGGLLLRLASDDFRELIFKPRLIEVSFVQAHRKVTVDHALWLDVRSAEAFSKGTLEGAISVPLPLLLKSMAKLDRKPLYICICDTSSLSAIAAYQLVRAGFHAQILHGGLRRLREIQESGLMGQSIDLGDVSVAATASADAGQAPVKPAEAPAPAVIPTPSPEPEPATPPPKFRIRPLGS